MQTRKEKGTEKGTAKVKGKYLNPKADLTFKLVFGDHKDLAMSFLNALLPLAEEGGLAKGRAEGIAEGKAEGIAEGKAEANVENATKMKAKGYPAQEIAEITSLTPLEIERL